MSQNVFNTVQLNKVNSNIFDMSYDVKLSCNMGDLIPVHCQEIIPGDRITMSSDALLRLAPMVAPIMHRVDVTLHHFFVPNRILWPNWEKFITGGQDPEDTPALPYFKGFSTTVGSIWDYMGLPITPLMNEKISALPFAAYNKIYNEYYRDQNIINTIIDKCVDGDITAFSNDFKIRKRAWQHDYFTASLPFAQKGPAVSIPIGEFSDVDVINSNLLDATKWHTTNSSPFGPGAINGTTDGLGNGNILDDNGITLSIGDAATGATGMTAKTSELTAEAATINNLRVAFRLQEWFERNARGGSRYIEIIKSHFGVTSSDARLDRPEYLGGSKQPIVISEVLQTSSSDAETPQANMAGHGVSAGSGKNFRYFAEEHGYIISIMSILPKTAYSQGIPRHFSKLDRLDYAWPTFAHLGEQEVKNKELYHNDADGLNDETWGYVPRYSEYRYFDSRIAGEFRTSLKTWHMGREFATRPVLNQSFIDANPTHRIFAVTSEDFDKVYCHIFHKIKALRKLPLFGTPSF